MTDPRTRLVAAGYDAIADRFLAWRGEFAGDPRREWEDELTARLAPSARVLELGCGAGTQETARLAQRFRLTGVDVSAEQVRRAEANAPAARFVCADFTELELEPESFEAVASFYAFNHVPRDLLPGLLGRIHTWLVRGGLLLASFGIGHTGDWTGEWLGATMYFSSFPRDTNSGLVRDAGFELLRDEVVDFEEPEGPARFQWVLARSI